MTGSTRAGINRAPRSGSGFTLIELVIVITILGILAAVALPRFVGLQRDARIAKLNAARGAVNAASAVIHAGFLTRGGVADTVACPGAVPVATATNAAAGTLCTENGVVQMANGYPASAALGANPTGIVGAAGLISTFSPTLAQLNVEGYGAVVAGAVTTFSVIGGGGTTGAVGAQINATCSFTYTAPAALGAAPIVSAITPVTLAGC